MLFLLHILGLILLSGRFVTGQHSTVPTLAGDDSSMMVSESILSTVESRAVIEHPTGLQGYPTPSGRIVSKELPKKSVSTENQIPKFSFVVVNESADKRDKELVFEELPIALAQTDKNKGYREDDGTYIIEDTAEVHCIMAYFKVKITLYYPTTLIGDKGETKYEFVYLYPPKDVKVSGSCNRDAWKAGLNLSWDKGELQLRFGYDEVTYTFYVNQFKLRIDTADDIYKDVEKEEEVVLKSEEGKRYWQTNLARSFRCHLLHDIDLRDDSGRYEATLHFEEARVQALTSTYRFKPPKHCIHRGHRDPTVPFLVAGVLILATIITVAGYAVFRYVKVKKFQYEQYGRSEYEQYGAGGEYEEYGGAVAE